MYLIVGLGNPGQKYKNTRHNTGFMVADFLANESDFSKFKIQSKFKAEIVEGIIKNQKVIMAKPQTYMNNSGEAVVLLKNFYKVAGGNIIIIYDELDLPFGKIRVREEGSAAGHNGVENIIKRLGTDNFIRIRVGIKNKKAEIMPADKFVLSRFSLLEKMKLKEVFAEVKMEVEKLIE